MPFWASVILNHLHTERKENIMPLLWMVCTTAHKPYQCNLCEKVFSGNIYRKNNLVSSEFSKLYLQWILVIWRYHECFVGQTHTREKL